jgi:uncharacterized protein YggT (Ycf19 family)
MPDITMIVITIAVTITIIARKITKRELISIIIGAFSSPLLVLFNAFICPFLGGDTSMWPLALVFTLFFGAIGATIGFGISQYIFKANKDDHQAKQ